MCHPVDGLQDSTVSKNTDMQAQTSVNMSKVVLYLSLLPVFGKKNMYNPTINNNNDNNRPNRRRRESQVFFSTSFSGGPALQFGSL